MKLNFQEFGDGRPLVILHGLFGSSDNWQSLAKRLGQRFHVFVLDQRNHGNSPHSADVSYPAMAEDVRQFLEEKQLAEVSLLGHSMGGKVAMQCALTFPDRIDKLAVVDIAPKRYSRSHDYIFAAVQDIIPALYPTRSAIDTVLAASIPDAATRQFLLKNIATQSDGTLDWKINWAALQQNYPALLDDIPVNGIFSKPVLFLRGGRSHYVEDSDWPRVLARFPNAHLSTIPKADHWVHADAPNEFLQSTLSFLED
jgi:pimeloyl-ACP methyl ester carboxylesterase